ncbi:MAG: hydrogenase maturation protease [Candidatus Eremiobacteraeota bacterium]|nr:hydrogenase maturation protease [Candidatus Eremiobacteraeota bacterium]
MDRKQKTIVIGLGNTILGDDGIGPLLVEELRPRLESYGIAVETGAFHSFTLMEKMVGHDRAFIVDAIQVEEGEEGDLLIFTLEELLKHAMVESPHRANLLGALNSGKKMGLPLPAEIIVLGIRIRFNLEITEQLSKKIKSAYPDLLKKITVILEEKGVFYTKGAGYNAC